MNSWVIGMSAAIDPVVAHQKPTREPRLHRMFGVGEVPCGLHASPRAAQENTMQRRALIDHRLQCMRRHPQAVPGELDEEFQRGGADAERNRHTDQALPSDQAEARSCCHGRRW